MKGFKVGDEVEYTAGLDKNNHGLYVVDNSLINKIYIIEEIDKNGWIWSSKFPNPYCATRNRSNKFTESRILQKNFHNPFVFKISTRQLRSEKLEEIGL